MTYDDVIESKVEVKRETTLWRRRRDLRDGVTHVPTWERQDTWTKKWLEGKGGIGVSREEKVEHLEGQWTKIIEGFEEHEDRMEIKFKV